MRERLDEVRVLLWLIGLMLAGGLVGNFYFHPAVGYGAMAGILVFGFFAFVKIHAAWRLYLHLRDSERATAKEPDASTWEDQAVNWWDLLKAGFVPTTSHARLVDERLRLGGRPTCYLERGTVRIPVWRAKYPIADDRLRRQHYVRMAALCHLVETTTMQASSYGVILFHGRRDGVAVFATERHREWLFTALREARQVIREAEHRQDPPPPENPNVCSGCKFGRQARVSDGTRYIANGVELPVIAARSRTARDFHSRCGDRFRWVPPHEDARNLDLRIVS
jgi:hypothetical protein